MKRLLVCAALATAVAVAVPGAASARHDADWHGGDRHDGDRHDGDWHDGDWHDGDWHDGDWGWRRGWRRGWEPHFHGGHPAYYGPYGCWRWVAWPHWHRVWACY
jgi:hypothetical protein